MAKKTDFSELTFCIPVRIDSEYRLRNLLGSYSQPLYLMCGYYSVGGAFLVDVEEYRRCGWENEHFAGWGPEDAERYRRLLILGEQPSRIAGSLYHLYHTRGVNSGDYDKKLAMDTKKEYVHVRTMADLGCGPGWYVAMLRRNGYDVQGYDGNPAVEEMSSLFFEDGFYCQNVDLTEEQCLCYLHSLGYNLQQIADILHVEKRSVERYIIRICGKFNIEKSRTSFYKYMLSFKTMC